MENRDTLKKIEQLVYLHDLKQMTDLHFTFTRCLIVWKLYLLFSTALKEELHCTTDLTEKLEHELEQMRRRHGSLPLRS